MWRWTVFMYLLIFYRHTSSQPVTEDGENARQARQLDFSECCPCPGADQAELHDFTAQESSRAAGDGSFTCARDLDDCPCRTRHSDSEGASSIFFPTSVRSDGHVVRPVEKKEDLKPLLHPEVDLASSVLQTLREATDEEYQEALARDAARSMAKAAEEVIFGDATPEASTGNIVTIIVKPKETEGIDELIPQESHVQESRCIHVPLESVRTTNLGKMREAPKSPSLLRDFFGLPRINKPTGLLHRNLLDMDSSVGASNIQEHVIPNDDIQYMDKAIKGMKKYAPSMKLDSNLQSESQNIKSSLNDDCRLSKVPDIKSPSVKNKLRDFIPSRSSLQGRALPLIPKMRLNNSLPKARNKNIDDLSLSPSNIQEHAAEKISFFKSKSHLQNILEKTEPMGLKNLLKLKDVELVPLKDLVSKAAERPKLNRSKLILPSIFNRRDDVILTNKDIIPRKQHIPTEIIEKIPKTRKLENLDHEVSPSNVIIKTTNSDVEDAEDTIEDPSDIQSTVIDKNTGFGNSQSNELTNSIDDCEVNIPVTESTLAQSTDGSLNAEIEDTHEVGVHSETANDFMSENVQEKQNLETNNEEDCFGNNNEADSMTDSSNSVNNVLEPKDTVAENINYYLVNKHKLIEENCSQEYQISVSLKPLENNPEPNLIKTHTFDKTLSSIKENIIKKLENLKNHKNSINQNAPVNESSPKTNENQDTHCQNEASIPITTMKPDICNGNLESNNESPDKVSMQDLQEKSDLMLQQEEKEQKYKITEYSETSKETTDPKMPVEVNSIEIENLDSEQSADSQNEVVMDPQNSTEVGDQNENNEENTCQSALTLQKQSLMHQTDANSEASELVINRIAQINNRIGSPLLINNVVQPNENDFGLLKSPLPDIQNVIKLAPPLPTLDDIKLKLISLFNKNSRDVELSPSEVAMATDASTSNFRSRLPPSRLEDLNLDILRIKPQSLQKIPRIDLHAYKTNLPLPKDLLSKSKKLQSALGGKDSILEANLDDLRSRMKTNTENILNTQLKPDELRNSIIPNQGIGGLSDDIHSQAKHAWRNIQNTLQSGLRETTKKPAKLPTHDLLKVISRNHEDVSDKLKALHMDFNDRMETMRNNLIDTTGLRTSNPRNRKTNMKSLSDFGYQDKRKQLSLRPAQPKSITGTKESKKTVTSQRREQQKRPWGSSSDRLTNQKKFRMPAAASLPVRKIVEVPELKTTMTKSPGLAVQRLSSVNSNFRNIESRQAKESSVANWKQASRRLNNPDNRLGKQINPFKESKIKVTFSTTPRPTTATRLQSTKLASSSNLQRSNSGTKLGRFGQREDHNGSPSEIKHSIITSPIHRQQNQQRIVDSDLDNESRQTNKLMPTRTLGPKLGRKENVEEATQLRSSTDLQSWPKSSESAFLSKVKEAVKARLSKLKSPMSVRQSDVERIPTTANEEALESKADMTRAASENTDIIEGQALKENASYKCTMVCTKE